MRTRQLAHLCVPVVMVAGWTGCSQGPDGEGDESTRSIEQRAGSPSQNQVLLDETTIPRFAQELPIPQVNAPTIIRDSSGRIIRQEYTVAVAQTTVQILPPGFPTTTVLAYGSQVLPPGVSTTDGTVATSFLRTVPGSVFENTRGIPTRVHWQNNITTNHFMPVDPTLHWANPNFIEPPAAPFNPFPPGYAGALSHVAHVTHNHGLVVASANDGIAEEWFTNNGVTGPIFSSRDYDMPNEQSPTALFYHDHTMGMTRLNLYAGVSGTAYFIRDPNTALDGPNSPLPKGQFEIPLVIQDRAFYTDGELEFPRTSDNPSNAYWSAGDDSDTVLVNGKVWPNLNVQPRQYRFRTLAAANSRIFDLFLDNNGTRVPFTIIGSDGGYLPAPQTVTDVTLGITERADILVDFSQFAPGTQIIMRNDNVADGEDPNGVGVVMRFTVGGGTPVPPPALSPSLFPKRPVLTPDAPRRIQTFHNILAEDGSSLRSVDGVDFTTPTIDYPLVGSTEEWDLVNVAGGGPHMVHLHLIEFQVVSHQAIDSAAYQKQWQLLNGQRPVTRPIQVDPTPFLIGSPDPALPYESGWKDTVRITPGTVTKILARWAPQETPAGGVKPGQNQFPIDPTVGPGYLFHCHLVGHEDHDMMRKMPLVNNWAGNTSYARGTVVKFQNVDYRARVDHTSLSSQPPAGNPSVWERVNNNDGTWQTQIIYAPGDRVLYQGKLYVALQQHQSQSDWAPSTTPSLWKSFPMTACAQLATLCQGETDPGASSCHDLGTKGDDAACSDSFSDCLAACSDNGGGPHEAADPCSGLCTPPTSFKVPDGATFSASLGTGAACFETNAQIATGTCTNGRQLTVNGVTVPCDGRTNWKLPSERNHGYCIQAAAGNASAFTVHH